MSTPSKNPITFAVTSPATGEVVWEGLICTPERLHQAVSKAREALVPWRSTAVEQRIAIARHFADLATKYRDRLAESISMETGKPRWEATAEAKLIPAKVQLSIDAYQQRTAAVPIDLPQGTGFIRYRPIGVMAVLGPFNFPAHLPNGHVVPALIAGNTVVFKPSEYTPGTGALLAELWHHAGLPEGVLQIVQGDRRVGSLLIDADVDGVLFTGSAAGGRSIHRALADRPEVLLALEMGGNNPMIVHEVRQRETAAYWTAVSAFISAGQRCTCARRLILPEGVEVEPLLEELVRLSRNLRAGLPGDSPEPFMGPVISSAAGERVLQAQQRWIDSGGTPLLKSQSIGENPALLTPGLIDMTDAKDREDEEVFGPLLQVIRVPDFDAALEEANRTRFGLSASLLSDNLDLQTRFRHEVRAGVVNCNQPTIGASGRLPFGGLGISGNHRPSGYHAADYCSDATAGIEIEHLVAPERYLPGMGTLTSEL
ncbi:succinylglutamate-semialdehyde dehydrogenase [Roseiconus nitratireducens]|uniref:L-glutamate gamma-semialdehyde dehydrogenase n=1 Tax=Roseiconus nitratireducens TaxID=2605748 RepID=A0A5M6DI99_9BACT|nr:succinylglutamate-semialdehyde dehydrogenase [Roseiconus nitratireducens]KAA5547203.1 succinylglutamate-semialdehyde dehydrogenase [Roseiconus nitratireducens]